ncbi:hypothetical protein MYSTI_01783 [Myxococcus stipitatus DSM 14675]|uniref:Lipoprotein n=1 Tax=Myxococcus stipitatus (strain DSM 14675 / JCM 12634 / Mx s8) TaxID=1278073 RepID=L7U5J8_MYXSD|nr:hypothetical protein [Myxococcus stipitatus]AGC43115.1 hypothetical protein MYSTI_01783 [Myxococcus stipitatus DSM 14675]
MLKKVCVSWMLVAGGVLPLAACDGEPKTPEIIDSRGPGDVVLLIERLGVEGPYITGRKERFKVAAAGESFKSVRWSATAGALEADAEQVEWTPLGQGEASLTVSVETESGKVAQGAFHFNVVAAPSTLIDPGPDLTGSRCELAFDSTGKGHALYLNDSHQSLWYATWDGTSWTTEVVDGPGFNNGGTYVWEAALAVDAGTGVPHIAYIAGEGPPDKPSSRSVRYATRLDRAWTLTSVSAHYYGLPSKLSIALNPAQGGLPTIAYDGTYNYDFARRTASGTWSPTRMDARELSGDISFDAAGSLFIPHYAHSLRKTYVSVVAQEPSTQESLLDLQMVETPGTYEWLSAAWSPDSHLMLLARSQDPASRAALRDITLANPLSASTIRTSPLDLKHDASDLAHGSRGPVIAHRHGTSLELITTDARGFWKYTQLGSVQDGTRPSVAIRPTTGTAHVCYQRDGKVNFQ